MKIAPERYVAHLDILGMRTLTRHNHLEAWHMLSAFEVALQKSTKVSILSDRFEDPIHIPDLVKFVVFSDTIVLYSVGNTPRDLRAIFIAVLNLFSEAMHLRVPIRVGISKDIFYVDEHRSMYVGPALIDAYDIGEKSQWLGIVLSTAVAEDALRQDLRSGGASLVVDWDVPTKTSPMRMSVANWPVALRSSFIIKPPLTSRELYSVFEEYYGPFEDLRESVSSKYINTVKFINEQYPLHEQK